MDFVSRKSSFVSAYHSDSSSKVKVPEEFKAEIFILVNSYKYDQGQFERWIQPGGAVPLRYMRDQLHERIKLYGELPENVYHFLQKTIDSRRKVGSIYTKFGGRDEGHAKAIEVLDNIAKEFATRILPSTPNSEAFDHFPTLGSPTSDSADDFPTLPSPAGSKPPYAALDYTGLIQTCDKYIGSILLTAIACIDDACSGLLHEQTTLEICNIMETSTHKDRVDRVLNLLQRHTVAENTDLNTVITYLKSELDETMAQLNRKARAQVSKDYMGQILLARTAIKSGAFVPALQCILA